MSFVLKSFKMELMMSKNFGHGISQKGIGILDLDSRHRLVNVYSTTDKKVVPLKFVLSIIYFLSLSVSLFFLFS